MRRAVLPRHAVVPARHGVRLVPAEENAAALGLAVDEVVGVAEARRLARAARAPRLREARCAGGRPGSSTRTCPPSRRSAAPTCRPRSRPFPPRSARRSVRTARTSRRGPSSMPVTRVWMRISTPSSRAASATRVRGDVRIDVSVAGHPDRAVERLRASPPAAAAAPPPARRAPRRGRSRARG